MDNKAHNIQLLTKAKPIRELLPELRGIMSKDCMQTLMAPQPTPRKLDLKPLTFTEMRSVLMELKTETNVKCTPAVNPNRKSRWNSSVKLPKTEPKTVTGKESSVRKTLKLQPKPMTFTNPVTPKAPKPVWNGKKSCIPDKNNVRISGVYRIPETPTNKSNSNYKNRKTILNKENDTRNLKTVGSKVRKPLQAISDAPLSNISSTSSCDSSFLQTEKKIQDLVSKSEAKAFKDAGPTLEDIEEVSPILSTPSKEQSRHEDFLFNNNDAENLLVCNSIICFDVVNQCNLNSMQLKDLLKLREQNEGKIKIMEQYLKTMTQQQKYIERIINDKSKIDSEMNIKDPNKENICVIDKPESKRSDLPVPCFVIKSPLKSPTCSYKIPKKNLCLRKKAFHKSMPNISNGVQSPNKDTDNKALSIYMKMKEKMIFLNTPVKSKSIEPPNTPAITSQNLQMQLDKLYNCS